jgi:hypothetical protein
VYGRTESKYGRELGRRMSREGRKREKAQVPTPEHTWTRHFDEQLRIVDPELAARADQKRLGRRDRYFSALSGKGGRVPERSHGIYLLSGGMLVCPTCGGHFEGVKTLWRGSGLVRKQVYVCSTRRRKPGVCPNSLELPMEMANGIVLDMIEGEVLGTRMIEELLSMVDQGDADNTAFLTADRDRLKREISNLMDLVAAGTPASTVAPKIHEREMCLARVEAQLRAPRRQKPNIERLREALTQRAEQWRGILRSEPKVARALLRKLVEPMTLHDESERPEWLKAETNCRPEAFLDGQYVMLASPPGYASVCKH